MPKRLSGYLASVSVVSDKRLLASVKDAAYNLNSCVGRDNFFGSRYLRNSSDLATRLRQFRAALALAGAGNALYAWHPSGGGPGTGSIASQMVQIGEEATEEWNEWLRSLLRDVASSVYGEWSDIKDHLAIFTEEVIGAMSSQLEKPTGDAASGGARNEILFHGNRCYSGSDGVPFTVTEAEDCVLQAFLVSPSMDGPTLGEQSGYKDRAAKLLRDLRSRYDGVFAAMIRCPGRRSSQGYGVVIRSVKEPDQI